ncbi:MAG TPA: PaaI family thioesterase [Streptosporangiaceae bacterium]
MTEPGETLDGAALLETMPFASKLGIVLDRVTPDEVAGRLAWAQELCTMSGVMHGGALMSLADTLGGVCAFLNLPEGANTATISSSTNFMRAVRSDVTATARPLSAGKTVIVVRTEIRDDAGKLVAQVTQAQAVIPARRP